MNLDEEQHDTCSYRCAACSLELASDVPAHPSRDVFCITCKTKAQRLFSIQRSAKASSFPTIFAKQKRPGNKKPLRELKQGWNWSLDGVPAEFIQFVDRVAKTYKKWVRRADGQVVKDVEGPLTDQSLHGKPK